MRSLKKRLDLLRTGFDEAYAQLSIEQKLDDLNKLEAEVTRPEIWNNPDFARQKTEELSKLNNLVQPWQTMQVQLSDISELFAIGDEDLLSELELQIDAIEGSFSKLKKELLFRGPYDQSNVVLRLTSGVGGLDAQDFTEILERMYLRWAEQHNMKTLQVERQKSDEAGIKTSVIEIKGPNVYGLLKSEHGVHRLVRLSPFNAESRETSFALVEVLPEIEPDKVELDPKDLKIDVYRSGGKGGQSVNTTDSAVRITHIPTGIVVAIQNERSQVQNKETALSILRGKLVQLQLEQHAESIDKLRAGKSAEWGAQIRNYVMHPYTLVKDTRTKHEDRDIKSVLDGKIDGFIDAYLSKYCTQQS